MDPDPCRRPSRHREAERQSFFAERDVATNGNIPLGAAYPNAITEGAAELHESGGDEPSLELSGNVRTPAPVDISPQQCRAARAWLEWSREKLAKQAGLGKRTITDFERGASNT